MNIFISYRRSDTQDMAGRLADRLRAERGIREVFIDVEGIDPGTDFVARLREALGRCDVCLVLVGPDWRGARDGGDSRLDDSQDFVRFEVATALAMGGKVLPVLANGASMPGAGQLPSALEPLARINAVELRHAHFDRDLEVLLDAIHGRAPPAAVTRYLRRHPVQAGALRISAGTVAALLVLLAVAAIHTALTGRSLDEALGGPGPVWLLIAAAIFSGAAAGAFGPWGKHH